MYPWTFVGRDAHRLLIRNEMSWSTKWPPAELGTYVVLSLNYYEKIFDLLQRVFSSLLFTWFLADKNWKCSHCCNKEWTYDVYSHTKPSIAGKCHGKYLIVYILTSANERNGYNESLETLQGRDLTSFLLKAIGWGTREQSSKTSNIWKIVLATKESSTNGGTQQMFLRGGSAPWSNPYPFIYHFSQKRYPFRIPSIDKWYPFHIPCLELYIPFNFCKCTVF